MKNKYIRFIVIVYISLNILGVIFYYTIPKGNFVKSISSVDLKQFEKYEVMTNPQVLALKSSQKKYNTKNYNFNYDGKDLEFNFTKENHQIIVDRKTSDDNKIEVYWYPGAITLNGIDFTNMIKEPNIKLIRSKLNIECEKQEYRLTQFFKDIAIKQFYEKIDNESNNDVTSSGSDIIYIRIPKTLKILGDEAYE
ncbi:MAG: hypothetical protein ACI8WT_000957 [Clostridium sp.]|jgi:hypothetical protein